jgi:electron-transferring-flavoprotein dehydrogenase
MGQFSVGLNTSVLMSHTHQAGNQPLPLTFKNDTNPVLFNLALYAGPEARYRAAGVYEVIKTDEGTDRLHIDTLC